MQKLCLIKSTGSNIHACVGLDKYVPGWFQVRTASTDFIDTRTAQGRQTGLQNVEMLVAGKFYMPLGERPR